MSEREELIFDISAEGIDEARTDLQNLSIEIQDLNRMFTTYLALARRMGLPENAMEMLVRIQQIRVAIQTLYRSIMLLYTASGPIGWAIGLGGVALSGLMMVDQMEMRRPQY